MFYTKLFNATRHVVFLGVPWPPDDMAKTMLASATRRCLQSLPEARLAQSAERKALNLGVVGSSPTVGVFGHTVGSTAVLGRC